MRRRRGYREIRGGVEGDREGGGIVEESTGDAESSTRSREREADSSRETRNRRPEREATIPPIETSADAVDEEISSSRRDLRFAFGVASREREKTRR
ncbi:hypothetical protein DY000_02028844 [Brassica cretica]|uniref:Uncharacterized protein n=1 Tax=Brassica cretica TaxID=69181 RepID=A0ABQ7DVK7_BRACR|nr:hypothetical protein DY000_02028844 [Brassica cretica]